MTTVQKVGTGKRKENVEDAPPSTLDPVVYNAFIATIQLKRIELAELTARSVATALPEVQLKVSQKFGVVCPIREERSFVTEAQLHLGFQTSQDEELGVITCTYRLEYTCDMPVTDELFDEFARRNVPLNAWPFLRETAMNLTQRFGWSGFVLPPFIATATRPIEPRSENAQNALSPAPTAKKEIKKRKGKKDTA